MNLKKNIDEHHYVNQKYYAEIGHNGGVKDNIILNPATTGKGKNIES